MLATLRAGAEYEAAWKELMALVSLKRKLISDLHSLLLPCHIFSQKNQGKFLNLFHSSEHYYVESHFDG